MPEPKPRNLLEVIRRLPGGEIVRTKSPLSTRGRLLVLQSSHSTWTVYRVLDELERTTEIVRVFSREQDAEAFARELMSQPTLTDEEDDE